MAGRPPLRIGIHGKINRINQGRGKWLARCRHRDTDGVTRNVEKLSPGGRYDQYGTLAEEELLAVLADRNRSTSDGGINADTNVADLVDQYLDRLEEDERWRSRRRPTASPPSSRNLSGACRLANLRRRESTLPCGRCATPMGQRWPDTRKRFCVAHFSSR